MRIIINTLFEMSVTASVVIMAVMLTRLFMRSCPKIYSYLLWAIVGIRLCIPVSFESRLSIFNLFAKTETQIYNAVSAPVSDTAAETAYDPYKLIGVIWLAGVLALGIYGIYTYYRLQHKLRVSFPMGDSVYGVEGLSSPFVIGFVSPKIYIPLGLDKETESYVLMHERTHLKRGDHIIKLFAFLLLCIYWFNPFCWLAFIFMSRDMEMSCDERVLGVGDISTEYSSALLSFAQNKRFPSPGPLCFGEVSVKRRIKNILKWKKPAAIITVISVLLCITLFVVCACGPVEEKKPEPLTPQEVETEPGSYADSVDTSRTETSIQTGPVTTDTTTADTTEEKQPVETAPDTLPPETSVQNQSWEASPGTQYTPSDTNAPVTEKETEDTEIIIDPNPSFYIPLLGYNEDKEPEQMDESEWSDIYDDYQPYLNIELP